MKIGKKRHSAGQLAMGFAFARLGAERDCECGRLFPNVLSPTADEVEVEECREGSSGFVAVGGLPRRG